MRTQRAFFATRRSRNPAYNTYISNPLRVSGTVFLALYPCVRVARALAYICIEASSSVALADFTMGTCSFLHAHYAHAAILNSICDLSSFGLVSLELETLLLCGSFVFSMRLRCSRFGRIFRAVLLINLGYFIRTIVFDSLEAISIVCKIATDFLVDKIIFPMQINF